MEYGFLAVGYPRPVRVVLICLVAQVCIAVITGIALLDLAAAGQKLQVDSRDFLVFGMNWGYMPIGENYTYDFWGKPDDFIKAVLAREMLTGGRP